jgi:cytochrome-b5 reductase
LKVPWLSQVRDELDALAAEHPNKLEVWYTVDRAPEEWKFSTGFITADMIKVQPPGIRGIFGEIQ